MPFSYPAPVAVQHLGLKDKLSEALLATQIEALFAATYPDSRDRPAYKDRLLELYLNEVFYGANVYGIHDTAAIFFIRHPTRSACRKLSTAAPDVGSRHRGFKRPAAGKTGTTNDHTDAWFTGFTPRLSRQRLGWLRRSPWPSK